MSCASGKSAHPHILRTRGIMVSGRRLTGIQASRQMESRNGTEHHRRPILPGARFPPVPQNLKISHAVRISLISADICAAPLEIPSEKIVCHNARLQTTNHHGSAHLRRCFRRGMRFPSKPQDCEMSGAGSTSLMSADVCAACR